MNCRCVITFRINVTSPRDVQTAAHGRMEGRRQPGHALSCSGGSAVYKGTEMRHFGSGWRHHPLQKGIERFWR